VKASITEMDSLRIDVQDNIDILRSAELTSSSRMSGIYNCSNMCKLTWMYIWIYMEVYIRMYVCIYINIYLCTF
jgi:hypothetical protein